jgi:hypothetical protein
VPGPAEQRILQEIASRPLLRFGDAALDEKPQGQDETPAVQNRSVQEIKRGRPDKQISERVVIRDDLLEEERPVTPSGDLDQVRSSIPAEPFEGPAKL